MFRIIFEVIGAIFLILLSFVVSSFTFLSDTNKNDAYSKFTKFDWFDYSLDNLISLMTIGLVTFVSYWYALIWVVIIIWEMFRYSYVMKHYPTP